MTVDPYAAPLAKLEDPRLWEPSVPDLVLKQIKNAWVIGTISGACTLAVTLLAIFGTSILGASAWGLLDVALIFGLTFGIYKKSRTCAVLMLVYFVASKIYQITLTDKPSGLVMGVVFIYYFAMGTKGTFAYHRILKAHRSQIAGADF
jgi:hypothetical protein